MATFLPEWEYIPEGWRKEDPRGQGWDHSSVARVMNQNWAEFAAVVKSVRPLGIYPLAPNLRSESGHNVSMTFGYVLARAAHGKERLSILDWGGALGHYALMAQSLLPEVALDITVKELPELCRIGRAQLPTVSFETDDDKCFAGRYGLTMASSSLHYIENWRGIASRLVEASNGWIYITRLSLVQTAPSFTVVQRPYAYGYQTEYISWVLNRNEFLSHMAGTGAVLEREFIAGGDTQYVGAPEKSETVGFLFKAPA
jgi:putative methyltransferase (TIGR04325 family)